MKIGVYGLGYVGAVTVACLAELGHEIIGVDISVDKVDMVNRGDSPVVEPGLDEMLRRHVESGQIRATTDSVGVAADVDAIILAVGTPSTETGALDTRYLKAATAQIGEGFRSNPREFVALMSRSTSLPAAHEELVELLSDSSGREIGVGVGYACHPEFLREATAIEDFFNPPMIVFGTSDPLTTQLCSQLYPGIDAELVEMAIGEAAMVKYAANCYHAIKVTFGNEMGELCRSFGLDSRVVMDTFCKDDKLNISARYLRPGNPFGGSCLPKDLRAVLDTARDQAMPLPMLQGTLLSNHEQINRIGDRVLNSSPDRVAVVGLSFKEGTDDLREAPLVPIVERLLGKGTEVTIFDTELAVDEIVGANAAFAMKSVPHLASLMCSDLQESIRDADVIIINHGLRKSADWAAMEMKEDAVILDLAGVTTLVNRPGYEGLYWSKPEVPDLIKL